MLRFHTQQSEGQETETKLNGLHGLRLRDLRGPQEIECSTRHREELHLLLTGYKHCRDGDIWSNTLDCSGQPRVDRANSCYNSVSITTTKIAITTFNVTCSTFEAWYPDHTLCTASSTDETLPVPCECITTFSTEPSVIRIRVLQFVMSWVVLLEFVYLSDFHSLLSDAPSALVCFPIPRCFPPKGTSDMFKSMSILEHAYTPLR